MHTMEQEQEYHLVSNVREGILLAEYLNDPGSQFE